VEQVVGVRRQALHDARLGLLFVLAPLIALVATQPNWRTLVFYAAFEFGVVTIGAARTIYRFGDRLESVEPLPPPAVEAAPRWAMATAGPVRKGVAGAFAIAPIVLLLAFPHVVWLVRAAAALIALYAADDLLVPLVEARVVARWEHSHGRLFRPLEPVDQDGEELYVADRPVAGP
jgi:hypothetical protein